MKKRFSFRSVLKTFLLPLLSILAFFALKKLYLTSLNGSTDFAVFWRAAQALWVGTNPYLALGEDRGFVFKYHPGALALFIPFAAISLKAAKIIWFGIETLSLLYCGIWLSQKRIRWGIVVLTTALFWFLWFEHFKYGQIMLPLLCVCLWMIDAPKQTQGLRTSFLIFMLSIKVFTLYALAGIGKKFLTLKACVGASIILIGTHILLGCILLKNGLNPLQELLHFYQAWLENALHSARDLGLDNVRGTTNHGFPAALLRQIDPLALHPQWDTPVSLIFALILGTLWWKNSKQMTFEKRWMGWIALPAVTHPLAWSHSFVFVYPMSAFALQAAFDTKAQIIPRSARILICLLGIGMMGLWVPQVVGLDRAIIAEAWGIKSWGALLCALSFIESQKKFI